MSGPVIDLEQGSLTWAAPQTEVGLAKMHSGF